MATLGNVPVKFFAQVGDCDQHEIGTIYIPLRTRMHPSDKGFVIDLDQPFEDLRALVQEVFRDRSNDGEAE